MEKNLLKGLNDNPGYELLLIGNRLIVHNIRNFLAAAPLTD